MTNEKQKKKKKKRERPQKQKNKNHKRYCYNGPLLISHKITLKYFYNMKFRIKNPTVFPNTKPLFIENISDKSNSIELNKTNTTKDPLSLGNTPSLSPEKNLDFKISPSIKSFCSINQIQETNDHMLKISNFIQNKDGQKEKCFDLKCGKRCSAEMEIKLLKKNMMLLNVKNNYPNAPMPNIFVNPKFFSQADIAVEFFQFFSDFKTSKWKELMFSGRLKKRNNFKFTIDYNLLEQFMLNFFQRKDISTFVPQMNDFEYIFVSIFLYKKNFLKWSSFQIDFYELQYSESKKRKEHFLKFLLKKFFKYLSSKKKDFFGEGNSQITKRMKSIFFESNRRRKDNPNNNRMENLGKILTKNQEFKNFYDNCDIDAVIKEIFIDYSERQMKTLIQNHISRLREDMKKNVGNQFLAFSNAIFGLMKKKLKIMWTYTEFEQAKNVLDRILNN